MLQFQVKMDRIRLLSQDGGGVRTYQLHIGSNELPSFVVEFSLDSAGQPVGTGRIRSRMDVLQALASREIPPEEIEEIAAAAMYAAQIAREKILE